MIHAAKADRRILDPVQRLRPVPHLLGIAETMLVEEGDVVESLFLLFVEAGRRRCAGKGRRIDLGRNRTGHVGVNANQSWRCLHTHHVDDERTPIAALRGVALVSQALHQGGPCPGNAFGAPAGRGRLAREAVARHRRNHEVKRVRGAPAVGRRIGQRLDDLELLDDRAGPAVGDDERQRILMLRANVNEMDVEPIDLGDEMRLGRSVFASTLRQSCSVAQ